MLKSFLSLVIHHPAIFDTLIQRGFRFIPKIAFGNLWMPFHDTTINPFSISSFNLKILGRKDENYKNLNISRTKIAKKALKALIVDTSFKHMMRDIKQIIWQIKI